MLFRSTPLHTYQSAPHLPNLAAPPITRLPILFRLASLHHAGCILEPCEQSAIRESNRGEGPLTTSSDIAAKFNPACAIEMSGCKPKLSAAHLVVRSCVLQPPETFEMHILWQLAAACDP